MCLAAIAIGQSVRFPWVLFSNRDEYFHRPADVLAWWHPWPDAPRILSGRDRFAGGTWLGLNEAGQLALVTNVREPGRHLAVAPSRGDLVPQWLLGERNVEALRAKADVPRNGFNLLTADLFASTLPPSGPPVAWWLSNRPEARHQALGAGVYGLSNAALDTPWPKVQQLKARLRVALHDAKTVVDLATAGFKALGDRAAAPDTLLPQTGVSPDRERQLSSAFIRIAAVDAPSGVYGTRCSTVLVAEKLGTHLVVHVIERTFDETGAVQGEVSQQISTTG